MANVKADLIYESQIQQDKLGYHHTRIFRVDGLPSNQTTPFLAMTLCPSYGMAHPFLPNCIVTNVKSEPPNRQSKYACKVTVTYGPPELLGGSGTSITISSAGGQKKISFDPTNGKPLHVSYTIFDQSLPGGLETFYDPIDVTVLSPNTILTVETIVTFTAGQGPLKWNRDLKRRVNTNTWQGGDKWTWLCRSVDGKSLGGGTSFQMAYVFEYDPDQWLKVESFKDALHGGQVPNDIEPADLKNPFLLGDPNNQAFVGEGTKVGGSQAILPYLTADFSVLGIPTIP
jgi:hypothetical protein